MKTRTSTALLLTTALFFAGTSCATASKGNASVASMKDDKSEDKKKDPEEKQHELADKERELRLAKMELQVKKTSTRHSMQAAEEKAKAAQVEVETAEKALALFRDADKPRRMREAELGVQRSEFRIENQEQDLQQMVDDYEGIDEHYAKATGEIVVWRTRKMLDFSRAELELTIQSRDKLIAHTLPDEEKELVRKLELSRAAHERAAQVVTTAGIEAEAELIRAEAKIEKLMREIEKAKSELKS